MVLDTAASAKGISDEDRVKYVEYGTILLTVAVIAIVFTAPLGAILINTLGVRWLSYDGEEQKVEEIQKVMPLKDENSQESQKPLEIE